MSTELTEQLLTFIQTSVDLAYSIRQDALTGHMTISDNTIEILYDFNNKHDELGNILDVVNGVM